VSSTHFPSCSDQCCPEGQSQASAVDVDTAVRTKTQTKMTKTKNFFILSPFPVFYKPNGFCPYFTPKLLLCQNYRALK
jgi:hypothetical protein